MPKTESSTARKRSRRSPGVSAPRRKRQAEQARRQYLGSLEGKEETLWGQVDRLISMRQPARYDDAVKLLVDLRDLAIRRNRETAFKDRLHMLSEKHEKKTGLLRRLQDVSLTQR